MNFVTKKKKLKIRRKVDILQTTLSSNNEKNKYIFPYIQVSQ